MLLDFDLPDELIATHPSPRRDHCKMLVFDRSTGKTQHVSFHEIPSFLGSDYFLVFNQAKVNPCRLPWTDHKLKRQEILFLHMIEEEHASSTWEAIVSGKKMQIGFSQALDVNFEFTLLAERKDSLAVVRINKNKAELEKYLMEKGQVPLPPYILKKRETDGENAYTSNDRRDYQTVFCKKGGAVAAPTAGLHFTNDTLTALQEKGVEWDFVHLAVGWGTFQPLTMEHFATKKLHQEYMEISSNTARTLLDARNNGKKILGVGTTSVRSLETWAQQGKNEAGYKGETDIFIMPPYNFQFVDAMLTNFHVPKSSLLMLVAAFLGKDGEKKILELYNQAIEQKYRFYSYGDCMLIL